MSQGRKLSSPERHLQSEAESSNASYRPLWRQDLSLLETCHCRLPEAVAGLEADGLARPITPAVTPLTLVTGIAHDLYRAGRVQLLRRMQPGA